ncbi:MAG: iron-containing alcohol dehydrogenase [Gemmataceae bacterium]
MPIPAAPWSFHTAGSYRFGPGVVAEVGELVRGLPATRAVVLSDKILTKLGTTELVMDALRAANVEAELFDAIEPEPSIDTIRQATEFAKQFGPGCVIGLGGGSNIDAAKLVALALSSKADPTEFVGDCRVPGPTLPMIAIPTTAGTGSEVSPAAVFTDTAKQMKVSCLSPFLRPAIALVDPRLTHTCPPKVTADSGIDALTHAIEAYLAVDQAEFLTRPPGGATVYQGRNPMATFFATECIMLIGGALRAAVADGSDAEARANMALAATYGGLAFSNAGVGLVHAMEYPVGGAVHVSHGAGNGLLLPYVLRFYREHRAEEIQNLALWLSPPEELDDAAIQAVLNEQPQEGIEAVERLRETIGIPQRLRDIGVKREMLPGFAERAFSIKRLLRTSPILPTQQQILEIYESAW